MSIIIDLTTREYRVVRLNGRIQAGGGKVRRPERFRRITLEELQKQSDGADEKRKYAHCVQENLL